MQIEIIVAEKEGIPQTLLNVLPKWNPGKDLIHFRSYTTDVKKLSERQKGILYYCLFQRTIKEVADDQYGIWPVPSKISFTQE